MKKSYLIPQIRIQAIDTDDIMEGSIPIFNGENPQTEAGCAGTVDQNHGAPVRAQ